MNSADFAVRIQAALHGVAFRRLFYENERRRLDSVVTLDGFEVDTYFC